MRSTFVLFAFFWLGKLSSLPQLSLRLPSSRLPSKGPSNALNLNAVADLPLRGSTPTPTTPTSNDKPPRHPSPSSDSRSAIPENEPHPSSVSISADLGDTLPRNNAPNLGASLFSSPESPQTAQPKQPNFSVPPPQRPPSRVTSPDGEESTIFMGPVSPLGSVVASQNHNEGFSTAERSPTGLGRISFKNEPEPNPPRPPPPPSFTVERDTRDDPPTPPESMDISRVSLVNTEPGLTPTVTPSIFTPTPPPPPPPLNSLDTTDTQQINAEEEIIAFSESTLPATIERQGLEEMAINDGENNVAVISGGGGGGDGGDEGAETIRSRKTSLSSTTQQTPEDNNNNNNNARKVKGNNATETIPSDSSNNTFTTFSSELIRKGHFVTMLIGGGGGAMIMTLIL